MGGGGYFFFFFEGSRLQERQREVWYKFFSLYTAYVMQPLVSYSTPGLHENDCRPCFFFCKSTVCNDHLSVWSVSSESCWVALQEMQGGNSYLTCTVDSVQLTERCHL